MAKNEVGVITFLLKDADSFGHVAKFGLRTCQLVNWDVKLWTKELALRAKADRKKAGVGISAVWAGYPGPAVWNFLKGPSTLGLVPPKYRKSRIAALKKAVDFAERLGAPAIATHCGFIPENPCDKLYVGTLRAIGEVARYAGKRKIGFWFETGQETPVVLLRVIEDLGLDNLGINLDTANLILYGKANPLDALEVFGRHVACLHAKDGLYPTDGRALGREVAIGKGRVDFPGIMKKLARLKFRGDVIIEREISGAKQTGDIRKAVGYLRKVIAGA